MFPSAPTPPDRPNNNKRLFEDIFGSKQNKPRSRSIPDNIIVNPWLRYPKREKVDEEWSEKVDRKEEEIEDVDMEEVDYSSFNGFRGRLGLPVQPGAFKEGALKSFKEALAVIFNATTILEWPYEYGFSMSKQMLYMSVKHMYELGMEDDLYEAIQCFCRWHVANIIEENFAQRIPWALYNFTVRIHFNFLARMPVLSQLLLHVDKMRGLLPNANSVEKVCLAVLSDAIIKHKKEFADALVRLVNKHRDGDDQTDFFTSTFKILLAINGFDSISNFMMEQLISETRGYYAQAFASWKNEDLKDLLEMIKSKLELEERLESYMSRMPRNVEVHQVATEQIGLSSVELLEKELNNIMEVEDKSALKMVYGIFKLANQLNILSDALRRCIANKGSGLITDDSHDNKAFLTVSRLLEGKTKSYEKKLKRVTKPLAEMYISFRSMVKDCFENNRLFRSSLSDGFKMFLSTSLNLQALLANVVSERLDELIRSDSDAILLQRDANALASLLMSNEQLPVFTESYTFFMSKRLLFRGRTDPKKLFEREEIVINELTKRVSVDTILCIRRMLQDVRTKSADIHKKFKKDQSASSVPLDLSLVNPFILSQEEWPDFAPSKSSLILPDEIRAFEENFAHFYSRMHSDSRVIYWPESLGTWTIRAHFLAGAKDIVGSKSQITVLMLLSHDKKLTEEQIKQKSGIPDPSDLLQALVKHNLLLKERHGGHIVYEVNHGFISSEDTIEIYDAVYEELLSVREPCKLSALDRHKKQVQAAIVHFMKGGYNATNPSESKTYTKEELFSIVTLHQELSEDFTAKDFADCLEGLANSKHIKLVKDDPQRFEYIP